MTPKTTWNESTNELRIRCIFIFLSTFCGSKYQWREEEMVEGQEIGKKRGEQERKEKKIQLKKGEQREFLSFFEVFWA
jgi:hypothetical protein